MMAIETSSCDASSDGGRSDCWVSNGTMGKGSAVGSRVPFWKTEVMTT